TGRIARRSCCTERWGQRTRNRRSTTRTSKSRRRPTFRSHRVTRSSCRAGSFKMNRTEERRRTVDNPTSLPHQSATPQRNMATFRDYWKVLRGGMWTILASFTIVVGLVAIWTFTQTPIYRSVATVEVRVNSGGRNNMFGGQDNSGIGVTGYGWG